MNPSKAGKLTIPALLFIITGGLFAYYYLLIQPQPYRSIEAGYFLDSLAIPFDWTQFGPISFPILVDNFLIFQEFKSLPPHTFISESLAFGVISWLAISALLALVSDFKKIYFIGFGIAWIILITLSNFNGLDIGGLSSNVSLISILVGTLGVPVFLHISGKKIRFELRFLLNLLATGITFFSLIQLSPIEQPQIFIAEHLTIPALILAIAWILWNGHGVVSGLYILLAKAGRNLSLKISIQFTLLTLIYILLMFNSMLVITGSTLRLLPAFDPILLVIPLGVLGWFTIRVKTESDLDLAAPPYVIRGLYLLGFGICLWVIWKLKLSGNQPALEFFKHIFTYSQLGFSLFFLIYVLSNFLNVMNSGKAIEQVLFKPYSLPYYHLRIGGVIAMLVAMAYADGIVGVQVNSLSNHVLGEYYYNTGQKLEASIIYENTWFRFRNNPKAKNATAQLLFELNQPTLAKRHLEESFAEAPQVDNILLLAERLHRENKILESIYYLETAIDRFPENPYLVNNLALFYIKANRQQDALALYENSNLKEPENLTPIQLKLGIYDAPSPAPKTISGMINELAKQNALGNFPEEELVDQLKQMLLTEPTPLLAQAGWRNLFSIKNIQNPSEELHLLDSLWNQAQFSQHIMALQETGVIRSLGAGRVTEAVKNLNGLAFRNPGDAGYFLQLSSSIMAQQMDFKKASKELIAAEEKGFQAFQPYHWSILTLGGFYEKAEQIRLEYQLTIPDYLSEADANTLTYLNLIENLNESMARPLFQQWKELENAELKTDLAIRILAYKGHGLDEADLKTLGQFITNHRGENEALSRFLENPDFKDEKSLQAFQNWLGLSDELTANPYLNPLVWAAVESCEDDLEAYEVLNTATEFSKDPILWIKKASTARKIGLANYATDALVKMQEWVSPEELEKLQLANY
ncbi:hypothetical protein [Algoriphagus vanfongensis]|uniref:hypothetical protein n=1 Tax=Algoriphagus vanfongensis TaxID=426371 RepID=UPI0004232585|nr:hypothetical protein [Algoriphagus vanfongensis]